MISAVMPTYAKTELSFERGEGAYLYDKNGRHYLDFCAGIATNLLGHTHPYLVHALKAQAEKLWHCSNLYRIPEQERLAQRLVEHTFADTVFFGNSGAEAIECALKMARKYHDETGNPDRYRTIVFDGAFHGRTLTAISAGGQPKHTRGFEPLVPGFDRVPFGDLNAVREAVGSKTAAILIEPIQGEGGIRIAAPEFLQGLRQVADLSGALLIFDEVQCGVGRTGTLFHHQSIPVNPDIMTVAKGLGGGFPIGACLATERAASGMTAGSHASTFGGNPLAMAVGNAVLDVVLGEGSLRGVQRAGRLMHAELEQLVRNYPTILAETRGIGLMMGLKCVVPNTDLVAVLQSHGMLTVPSGDNVIRLVPPLIIGPNVVEQAIDILDRSCRELAKGHDSAS
ncbi:MAG: aspartate aminotransferase family protein [Alphaproteobacteria bacterium]|nr:aspartate aminotransferase family protein [Alphaproteobacteria bacterium]